MNDCGVCVNNNKESLLRNARKTPTISVFAIGFKNKSMHPVHGEKR